MLHRKITLGRIFAPRYDIKAFSTVCLPCYVGYPAGLMRDFRVVRYDSERDFRVRTISAISHLSKMLDFLSYNDLTY